MTDHGSKDWRRIGREKGDSRLPSHAAEHGALPTAAESQEFRPGEQTHRFHQTKSNLF